MQRNFEESVVYSQNQIERINSIRIQNSELWEINRTWRVAASTALEILSALLQFIVYQVRAQ
jgi:hypothetical protein